MAVRFLRKWSHTGSRMVGEGKMCEVVKPETHASSLAKKQSNSMIFLPFHDVSARELLHLLLQHRTAVRHYELTVFGVNLTTDAKNRKRVQEQTGGKNARQVKESSEAAIC